MEKQPEFGLLREVAFATFSLLLPHAANAAGCRQVWTDLYKECVYTLI
jgi:hypothetical protein